MQKVEVPQKSFFQVITVNTLICIHPEFFLCIYHLLNFLREVTCFTVTSHTSIQNKGQTRQTTCERTGMHSITYAFVAVYCTFSFPFAFTLPLFLFFQCLHPSIRLLLLLFFPFPSRNDGTFLVTFSYVFVFAYPSAGFMVLCLLQCV